MVAVAVVVEDGGLVVVCLLVPVCPVVLVAEQPVLPQREGVAGDELPVTRHAAETFQVKYSILGPHHIIIFPEGTAALVTFSPEEPDVVLLAVGFAVPHEARTRLVKEHLTFVTLKIFK